MNEIRIHFKNGNLLVPSKPIIPFIEGDGLSALIWKATKAVIDTAVYKTYGGIREIHWKEIFAGEKALAKKGEWLPEETILSLEKFLVGIKGPLAVGPGNEKKNIDVALMQRLNLNASLKPLRWQEGLPYPNKNLNNIDMFIFRKKLEDIYTEVEFLNSSSKIENLKEFLLMEIRKNSLPFPDKVFPRANINLDTGISIFEAVDYSETKNSASKEINPYPYLLSGAMMLEYLGWREASDKILEGVHEAVKGKPINEFFIKPIRWKKYYPYPDFARAVLKNL